MVIHTEKKLVLDTDTYRLDIPLTLVRYLKILIITSRSRMRENIIRKSAACAPGSPASSEIKASSASSPTRGPENLLSESPETFWESEPKTHSAKETLFIDLGKIFHVNRIILGSAQQGFPENFYIETSSDNNVWMPLLEEKNFKSQVIKKIFLEHRHQARALHPHRGEGAEIPGRQIRHPDRSPGDIGRAVQSLSHP